jgi:hypothetical protein
MPSTFYKPVTSTISTRQESSAFHSVNGSGLSFSLCDRTVGNDKNTNYFMSFNMPIEYDVFQSGSTLALSSPELLQLNVDKMVIVPIPREYYNELIDGRSITFTVPQNNNGITTSAKTIVSSTYSALQKKDNNVLLGNNIAFLFSDDINLPYSGTSNGGTSTHTGSTTWNTTSFANRPAAVPYSDLVPSTDINTDKRPFSAISFALPVTSTYPTSTNQGYNYDIPVGFVCLDKGFMVLTHPTLVNNIPWALGQNLISNSTNPTSATTNIYFSAVAESTFTDINISYKTSVVCIGMPGEFYFTNNPSWDLNKNAQEFNNGTNNFDSLFVTEVGLYNRIGELIAIAKMSEPVEKNYTNLLTFNLDIDV